ncbi:MAG TPA: hypothetical protein PJ994_11340, partial [Tepidiformaceae bacterium]|nr:hypothetical protein [Tepidiformaceae bacterium]
RPKNTLCILGQKPMGGTMAVDLRTRIDGQERAVGAADFFDRELPALLVERAATLAAEHQLRGTDALYFAVAETLGDRLVTLNPRQLQRGGTVVETARPRV